MKTPLYSIVTILVLIAVLICLRRTSNARTETGTAPWIKQAPIPTSFGVQGVAALSSTECWVAATTFLDNVGELAHTTDAGRTWAVVSTDQQVMAVASVDPLHGWAGGNAWSRYRLPPRSSRRPHLGTADRCRRGHTRRGARRVGEPRRLTSWCRTPAGS